MLKELVQQPRCSHACKDSSCRMEGRGSPEDVLEGGVYKTCEQRSLFLHLLDTGQL